jgi:transcriptional regulator with XRE-family HTH domain
VGHDSQDQNEEAKGRLSSLSICVRLRDARLARGLTLEQLAHLAGITGAAVSYIENGKTVPRADTIERLARALNVPRSWLAFGDGRKPELIKPRRAAD